MVGELPRESSGGLSRALGRYDSSSPSSPDDGLWVSPRRPAVEGAVEDPEGQVDAQVCHPFGGLLLLEEGVGYEVGHLEQVVVLGASEGRAADDPLYGVSFVARSSQTSYLLGTGLRILSLP